MAEFSRQFRQLERELRKDGPPDVRAIRAAAALPAGKEKTPSEIEWLKGQKLPSAGEPNQPDTDHNVAAHFTHSWRSS